MTRSVLFLAILSLISSNLSAQPAPKHEFRAAWIATVTNLDWPSSRVASPAVQQAELVQMLDRLKAAGINAVYFQVRTENDALYASEIEPWSHWLTGQQGRSPNPFYDPLEFAIDEAHKRGMELHAWFNPYRSVRSIGSYALDETHVSVRRPDWILTFNDKLKILDPGLQEVRDYNTTVIMDVVNRYDIDGVHFDDYFYPYPPDQITNEDNATFAEHSRGFTNRGDWRRDNVNLFVKQIADSIAAVKPHVKYGISPFGIWKSGTPGGIVGLDAYNVIFADAVTWMQERWLDYLTPQLYWPFGGGQDYGRLAPWWASQIPDRHLYPGHGLYRSDQSTFSGALFSAGEVPRQVRFNRDHPDILGSVFFRAKNITNFSSRGFADSLKNNLYRHPAITPPMEWKDQAAPDFSPGLLTYSWTGDDEVLLDWTTSESQQPRDRWQRYAVYRIRSAATPNYDEAFADSRNLLAVTSDTRISDKPGIASEPYRYVVRALSDNSIEGPPSNEVMVEGRAVAVETLPDAYFVLHQSYPNPFADETEIRFVLERRGNATLSVYNVLGQLVVTLVDGRELPRGTHAVRWNGVNSDGVRVPNGTYFYSLRVDGRRETGAMVKTF